MPELELCSHQEKNSTLNPNPKPLDEVERYGAGSCPSWGFQLQNSPHRIGEQQVVPAASQNSWPFRHQINPPNSIKRRSVQILQHSMPSLLLVVFLVELAIQLINTVGATTINNLLWHLILSFPSSLSNEFAVQRKKQKDYLVVRRDLKATSSQDEFAKWAKLRRQHDKLLEDLEKQKASLDATRAKFDRTLTTVRMVSTKGMQWFLPFWYSKEPMFWLPHGWFPYYVEWFVSFPRAPIGSVSIVMWQAACSNFVALVFTTLVAIYGLAVAGKQEQRQAQAVPAGSGKTESKKGQ